jgi:hypothetical protein
MLSVTSRLDIDSEQRFAVCMLVLSVIIFVAIRRAERRRAT